MKTVYVGGCSLEIERATKWTKALRDAKVEVVSTWIENVVRVGDGNPRDATARDRRAWASKDLLEVKRADILWMLVPHVQRPTRGAWAEVGYAYALGKRIVFSGDTTQSIFCALGDEFFPVPEPQLLGGDDTDRIACMQVIELSRSA